MRFNVELDGVMNAGTQEDADALATVIEQRLMSLYGPTAPASLFGSMDARLASVTVAAVTEKTAVTT